ncbi:MAG: DegT/DnrJ/EryC1/StrS family aminotransferase [Spirochaetaceae bacterium]
MSSSTEKLAINGGTPVRSEPVPQRNPFDKHELTELTQALESGNLFQAGGTKVYDFLDKYRALYGVAHVVPSSSGTAALHVALGALNLNPGDEVIVPPVTDMGSIAPIVLSGAIPVFADIELDTFNVDPVDVASKITDRTRAIMVVHVWGRPARLAEIQDLVKDRDIAIIEDCAESHYVRYRGNLLGTMGDFGCFSFQQSKHITSGDGGATIVNNERYLQRAELFVDKGCDWTKDRSYRKTYAFIAPCYRMNELQGAVLSAQMDKLPDIIAARQRAGAWLAEQLQDLPGVVPPPLPDEEYGHGYWGFPLRIVEEELGASRDEFRDALAAENIKSDVWIGKPLYLYDALSKQISFGESQWPFRGAGNDIGPYEPGLCPNAEKALSQLCNVVRVHEQISDEDLATVAEAIRKVAKGLKK